MIPQPNNNHNDHAESPWDEVDVPEAEVQNEVVEIIEEEESVKSRISIHKGERRSSMGATRPVTVTESRDSLQSSEGTAQKPLRDTLKFDLTQPWQRSLLRDLEQIEKSMLQDESETRARPQADRILLGHAESGDYLLECEDDISTCTDASSTCPTRLQVVHRHQFPMRPRFPSREDSPTPDPTKFYDIRNSSPKGVYDEASFSLTDNDAPAELSSPYLAHSKHDSSSPEGFRPIPHALPYGKMLSRKPVSAELFRSNAFSEEAKPVEATRVLVDEEPDYSDPACMCMGYSSLIDLLLFNEPTIRKKKRRTNFWESPSTSRRASMTSLNRVQEGEEEEDTFSGLNPFCMPMAEQPPPHFHPTQNVELHEERRY
mmetsp:Transcript_19712/g.37365  ORF Transcript_19712/g.37365 Transcript_19712/m.37365 type:complete len:373 (-) Transcript_19712:129-1247(-)|eukprot:scaffold2992_cov214-Amphora_coffeaeformis.AAC.37